MIEIFAILLLWAVACVVTGINLGLVYTQRYPHSSRLLWLTGFVQSGIIVWVYSDAPLALVASIFLITGGFVSALIFNRWRPLNPKMQKRRR